MHELSIAESLLAIVQEGIGRHCPGNVIGVKAGKLTAVQSEALSFCFELITENTSLKGATLDYRNLGYLSFT